MFTELKIIIYQINCFGTSNNFINNPLFTIRFDKEWIIIEIITENEIELFNIAVAIIEYTFKNSNHTFLLFWFSHLLPGSAVFS